MPRPAQDRIVKGPFGALLILLSLLIGSGTATAGLDLRSSAARLGPSRPSAAAALPPTGIRNPLDEDSPDVGGGVPPVPPSVFTRSLWARPVAEPAGRAPLARPKPADPAHRARAPPAI